MDNAAFQKGDARHLDFPDETFDAVTSNYVYHNVMGADKRVLLLETLRVLKKGGVFALNDDMKPRMYGDMEEFARELRDMGYEDVRLIDTAAEAFGSRRWACHDDAGQFPDAGGAEVRRRFVMTYTYGEIGAARPTGHRVYRSACVRRDIP